MKQDFKPENSVLCAHSADCANETLLRQDRIQLPGSEVSDNALQLIGYLRVERVLI
jgi:hypothetical protein